MRALLQARIRFPDPRHYDLKTIGSMIVSPENPVKIAALYPVTGRSTSPIRQ